jgi:hypothetical protein
LVFIYRVAPQLRQVGIEPEAMGIFQMMALELCSNLVEPELSYASVPIAITRASWGGEKRYPAGEAHPST